MNDKRNSVSVAVTRHAETDALMPRTLNPCKEFGSSCEPPMPFEGNMVIFTSAKIVGMTRSLAQLQLLE